MGPRTGKAFCIDPARCLCNKEKIQTKGDNDMNNLTFKSTWKEAQGKLKQMYAQLTDDDLLFVEGKYDELLGRLEKKLGKSKDEIRKIIADL